MDSSAEPHQPDPIDPIQPVAAPEGRKLDVPGLLAARISDLYAAEEKRQRNERTKRLLAGAVDPSQPQ